MIFLNTSRLNNPNGKTYFLQISINKHFSTDHKYLEQSYVLLGGEEIVIFSKSNRIIQILESSLMSTSIF